MITVLAFGDQPDLYGLPGNPTIPAAVLLWKGPLKWLGNLAMLGGLAAAAVHFVRFGRKDHDRDAGEATRSAGDAAGQP